MSDNKPYALCDDAKGEGGKGVGTYEIAGHMLQIWGTQIVSPQSYRQ